jgi:hypothetical protein
MMKTEGQRGARSANSAHEPRRAAVPGRQTLVQAKAASAGLAVRGAQATGSRSSVVQSKSPCPSCGGARGERQLPVQARSAQQPAVPPAGDIHGLAAAGVSGSAGTLPHGDRIQRLFGPRHDVSSVQAHVGGAAQTACTAMGAEAYATGNSVAFSATPSLHLAAHEAAHVMQQRAGVHLSGGVGKVGDEHERHADAVADRVVAGQPAEDLLVQYSPGAGSEPVQAKQACQCGSAGCASCAGKSAGAAVQKSEAASPGRQVQMAIIVEGPGDPAVNTPGSTNAQAVQGWLQQLSPDGGWAVNAGSGAVESASRDAFCGARPQIGQPHQTTSSAPASSRCICELTAPAASDFHLHVADLFSTPDGQAHDVNAAGEGVTVPQTDAAGTRSMHVGISGNDHNGIPGAADTSPLAGTGQDQTLRDPPFIILGHELCGHARKWDTEGENTFHMQTPEGDRTAVDVENQIRREHSTVADSFGVRKGNFQDATGASHDGSGFRVQPGDTLFGIAARVGIPRADVLNRVFRENGAAITVADQDQIRAGELLLVEGAYWHTVIRDDPQIANPNLIHPGGRVLIPAS